jgi:hypothetical protein
MLSPSSLIHLMIDGYLRRTQGAHPPLKKSPRVKTETKPFRQQRAHAQIRVTSRKLALTGMPVPSWIPKMTVAAVLVSNVP